MFVTSYVYPKQCRINTKATVGFANSRICVKHRIENKHWAFNLRYVCEIYQKAHAKPPQGVHPQIHIRNPCTKGNPCVLVELFRIPATHLSSVCNSPVVGYWRDRRQRRPQHTCLNSRLPVFVRPCGRSKSGKFTFV